ncbi:MAG: FixH family protein [Caldilineales bacterium]
MPKHYSLIALLCLLLVLPGACSKPTAPGNAATTTGEARGEKSSDAGLFKVAYTSALDPIGINETHSWTLHVTTADGTPVNDAEIRINGGMPAHGHGLPTRPQVTQNLGNGDYRVEGFRFQMGGLWEVRFDITAGGQSDSVTFEFSL